MELLERDEALAELHRQFERSATHGRLVVVSGEAGIGKTALVSRFLGECVPTPMVLWGACDPLHTPRPLGPIRDAARDAGGRLAALAAEDAPREVVFESVLDALRPRPPRILVISPRTVDHHVSAVLARLGAANRVEAARLARARELTSQDGQGGGPR